MGKLFRSRIFKWLAILVVAVIGLLILLLDVLKVGSIDLPPAQTVKEVSVLDQSWAPGWEIGQTQWFHHAGQGTKIIKYDWFMALQQPRLSVVSRPGLFSSSDYLQRYGFLPSVPDPNMNPDGLPIGFARHENFQEPYDGAPAAYTAVGFTCAACHTTQINYKDQGVRIEGGPAMVDMGKFQAALGRAIFFTDLLPWRFNRFAKRALGDDYNDQSSAKLRAELKAAIAAGKAASDYAKQKHLYDLKPGFSRTDALGLILNRVFDDLNEENLSVADAPVNFPHIWDSSWFEWVQYNASIRTPMARNIGEALGVGALINLKGDGDDKWRSTVDVKNLRWMEQQLAGDEPYGGLTSPSWPREILGELDDDLIKIGEPLYDKHCQSCHWKVEDIQAAYLTESGQGGPYLAQMWTQPNVHQKRFINTSQTMSNLERIGTDPGQAINFARRVVVTTSGGEVAPAGPKLDFVTNRVREVEYKALGLLNDENEAMKFEYDAYRVPWEEFLMTNVDPAAFKAEETYGMLDEDFRTRTDAAVRLQYKARPLNGIWATAPYLHNGSVRNLYQLLLPAAEREQKFYLGSKEFDTQHVGFVNEQLRGGFEMDTTLAGNRNTGHEFRDTKPEEGDPVKGVIGPALSRDERMAIIEYLKSL